MHKHWALIAVACMAVTAPMAIFGGAALRSLLLIELLITLSLAYVNISGRLRMDRLFDLPVLITARMVLSFGIAPIPAILMLERLNGRLLGDYDLILQALLIVITGMVGFWAGCQTAQNRLRSKPVLVTGARTLQSALVVAVVVYAIGFGCKVYLLQHQLFAFTASLELYRNNLEGSQWFMFGASFATLGLLLMCIEKFSHPSQGWVRWLFWGIVLSECWWGLVSGMKEFLLKDFVVIGAVATICRGKLAKTWIFAAVLGLVLLYPFYNDYRAVVRGAGSSQVNTFEGAFAALGQTTTRFYEEFRYRDWIDAGTDASASRLDLLQGFGLVLSFPNRAAELQGEEQLWMIPFYPFIPRTIWTSKPILDKGARFDKALGGTGDSSEAVPYVADCYIYGGVLGVVVGMFALGLFAQRYANCVKGVFSKNDLLQYAVALLYCFNIEVGVVEWWTGMMKIMVVAGVVGWLAYGSSAKRTTRTVVQRATSLGGRSVEGSFRAPPMSAARISSQLFDRPSPSS